MRSAGLSIDRRPVRLGIRLLYILLPVLSCLLNTQADANQEYKVKAAFLYNAAKFVDWPTDTMAGGSFAVCVLGDDPFGPLLDEFTTRPLKGKRVVVRRFNSLDKLRECQLVFITATERRRLGAVFGVLRDLPVLTVSDMDGFVRSGGMIEMSMDKGKLTFDVNHRQNRRQGLKISAQMLKLAREIVE